jgi:hypothetical protein
MFIQARQAGHSRLVEADEARTLLNSETAA